MGLAPRADRAPSGQRAINRHAIFLPAGIRYVGNHRTEQDGAALPPQCCVHSFATIQALELSADDDHCWGHFGPMFHVGDAAFVWIALLLGARHVFHENQLHFEEVGKLLAGEHVTIVKLVPSMLQLMCESESIKALRFPGLRWILTGGAALDPALVHRVATLFDCDVIQGYGMTEATCHVAFKAETQAPMKEGLRVLPGLDLKVVDRRTKR